MSIKFNNINQPYMYGKTATVGNRSVEVVRVYEGQWTIFMTIDGKTVNGQKHLVSRNMDKASAIKQAREFLTSKESMETWDNQSDIGKRT